MRTLSLAKKFSLLLAMFVSITIGVLYMLISSYNEPVRFAEQEKRGNAYQRPVEKLLQALTQHHYTAMRFLAGEAAAGEHLKDLAKSVDAAFAEVAVVQEKYGKDLQFTAEGLSSRKRDSIELSKMQKKWQEIQAKPAHDLYLSLIGDVRTTITHLGDTSNLILDPDLDSYYLMDITLLALPQAQDRIHSALVELEPLLRAGRPPTVEDRVKASVFVAMMKESDLARIMGDFDTTLHEDVNFNGKSPTLETVLAPAQKSFAEAYGSLILVIDSIAQGNNPGVENLKKAAEAAHAKSFEFWDHSVNELDQLLNMRIDVYYQQKVRAIAFSMVGLLAALALSVGLLRSLIGQLNQIVSALNASSLQVLAASNKSSESSSTLSSAATEQAASLQETMASVEEIAAMVRQNADSAARTQSQVESNQATAEDGAHAMDEMMNGIQEIRVTNEDIIAQMESGNREIAEIVKIIKAIEAKTNVINDIVSQTKLLSFNASVEAARAGEHGKGFAVVAEEVGNLARMSGTAAKEIGDMLSESVRTVNGIVESTRTRVATLVATGKEKVSSGEATAIKCKGALTEITQKAQSILQSVTEIAQASREQSQGVQEINKAMSQLGQVTQQNLSVSQESSTQAAELSEEAKALAQAVRKLKMFIDGAHSPSARAEEPSAGEPASHLRIAS